MSNGIVTLNATTCEGKVVASKLVSMGIPIPVISSKEISAYGEPTVYLFTANVIPGGTYYWYVGSTLRQSGPDNTFDEYFPCNTTKTVKVYVTNACETSPYSNSISYTGECIRTKDAFMLSPNPASSIMTVSTVNDSNIEMSSNHSITGVKIYDQFGLLKKQAKFVKVKTATFNISSLPTGVYMIEIFDGNFREQQQLLIKR